MKPRLPAAPLTKEDTDIFYTLGRAYFWLPWSAVNDYRAADRRDAHLMLSLGTSWATLTPRHTPEPLKERAERRLLWLLTRAYGSGLHTQPQDISCFA